MESARVRDLQVRPDQLSRRVDPEQLPFETTDNVASLSTTIGQPRAIDAITLGLEIDASGYNLYVAGSPGSGRESTVIDFVTDLAEQRPTRSDWVYVYNFQQPDQPTAIELEPGCGSQLARDMEELVETIQLELPRAFESEDYEQRRRDVLSEPAERRDQMIQELQEFAREHGFTVQATRAGIVSVPVVNGHPISNQEFAKLPESQQQEIQSRAEVVQERISSVVRQIRQAEKEMGERVRELEHEVVMFVLGPLIDELRERYGESTEVVHYLDQVQQDIPNHLPIFLDSSQRSGQTAPGLAEMQQYQRREQLARYEVNVLIDHSETSGAPMVSERNPTHYNLVGRVDYRATFGSMMTDFRQIKPGALHRANGGFLVLHVIDVLSSPFAWDALKRSLLTGEVRIENLGDQFTAVPTARLRPEPIPLKLKIILIGPPIIQHLLYATDEDFPELFKIKADYAPDMEWSDDHIQDYAAFIARRVREEDLRHFDNTAVARLVEHGARLRDHQRRLSTRLLDIANLITEASYWAGKAGHEHVQAEDVDRAIDQREYRSNLVEERIHEAIDEGTIMIDTTGERVAQVNGIAIAQIGEYQFGKPSRLTARVAVGRGWVRSIERETELSGPIHSKGVLVLSGYLQGQYAQEVPSAINATLTFEQAYDEVDGDSASSTELYALLSALSGLPLRQDIAATGSVNQHGEIQAVGGVTRKIEGFFAVCQAKGLTGEQGVIIPAANIQHLMLKDEVVTAVRDGQFHVWAIRSVDEGIELLTGRPAGERGPDVRFPDNSVHRLVEDHLREFADRLRTYTVSGDGYRQSSERGG